MIKKLMAVFSFIVLSGFFMVANAATPEQALSFFNKYVNAANTYSDTLPTYYAPEAKIIRVVMKPDGTTQKVVADTKRYFNEMRVGANLAKVTKYKNTYTDRKITKIGNDYKISCMRQPSTSDYKIPAYFIVGPDASGNLKIKEEMMYTKVQKFLKYAK